MRFDSMTLHDITNGQTSDIRTCWNTIDDLVFHRDKITTNNKNLNHKKYEYQKIDWKNCCED